MTALQTIPPGMDEVIRVHAVADMFPMLSDAELDDLAADIAENGLVHPIVLDKWGTLLDGRNRLEACRRAKVEPEWVTFDGDDPVAFILSSNLARRDLTKGQKAMLAVRALGSVSESDIPPQGMLAAAIGVSRPYINGAYTIADYAPDLIGLVIAAARPFDKALTEAQERKRARESAAEAMAGLVVEAPDLAELVKEERMSLSDALAALRERKDRQRQRQATTTRMVFEAVVTLDPGTGAPRDKAVRLVEDLNPDGLPDGSKLTRERLQGCMAVIQEVVDALYGEDA